MSKQGEEEKLAIRQKLRIALSGAGVEQGAADRHIQLIERLQADENLYAAEVLAIGDELIALVQGKWKPVKGDIVAEMADSVIRVERVG